MICFHITLWNCTNSKDCCAPTEALTYNLVDIFRNQYSLLLCKICMQYVVVLGRWRTSAHCCLNDRSNRKKQVVSSFSPPSLLSALLQPPRSHQTEGGKVKEGIEVMLKQHNQGSSNFVFHSRLDFGLRNESMEECGLTSKPAVRPDCWSGRRAN